MSSFDFIIIGTGNISFFLMKELLKVGGKCRALVGRDEEDLSQFSSKFDNNIQTIDLEYFFSSDYNLTSDIKYVFLAVSDDAIKLVAERLKKTNACVVHCSGARPLKDISQSHYSSAVLYPLQSILKDELEEDLEVPFLIESSDQSIEEDLLFLIRQMGYNAIIMSSEKRLKLHLCAVWINNFVNYVSSVAQDILVKESLSESLMMPLMDRTLKRLKTISANQAQTGPAKRGDYKTINAHLDLLEGDEQDVYKLLSKVINRKFNN